MLPLGIICYIAIVALAVAAIDWRWPRCSFKKLILIPAVPVPAALLLVAIFGYFWFDHKPARDVGFDDSGGYVLLLTVMMPLSGAALTSIIGLTTTEIVGRFLRSGRQ